MIELRVRSSTLDWIDGSAISVERICDKSSSELQEVQIETSAGLITLTDLFSITRTDLSNQAASSSGIASSDETLLLVGDCTRVRQLGFNHSRGTLVVRGNVGDRFGEGQEGGRLLVLGDVGDEAFAGKKDGESIVFGNCGDRFGAPLPGDKSGIRGGDCLVYGNVGDRACERLRRGTIVIGGDAGEALGAQCIAGTIIVFGDVGEAWGMGMRRGSLIFLTDPCSEPGCSLSDPKYFELSFLPLVWKHLRKLQGSVLAFCDSIESQRSKEINFPTSRWVSRQLGDMSIDGQAEVLCMRRISHMTTSDFVHESHEAGEST